MEKANGPKITKERPSQEQLEYYVAFLQKHPELELGKNGPLTHEAIRNFWKQLVMGLNKIKGPTLTPLEWKTMLSHWKGNVRFRARRAEAQSSMPGIVPQSKVKLSKFEELAIRTFGITTIEGEFLQSPHCNHHVGQKLYDQLCEIVMNNLESQRVHDERIMASNLALQETLKKVVNSFEALTDAVAHFVNVKVNNNRNG